MNRRRLALSLAVSGLLGLGAWSLWQRPLPLDLARPHPVMARAYPAAIAGSRTGAGLLTALAALEAPERRATTRERLADLAESGQARLDLGLGPADSAPELPGAGGDGSVTLPPEAAALAATTDGLLLLLHVPKPGDFALPARQRGWIGPRVEEIAAKAESVTVAVAETGTPATLRVTLALAYPDGAAAEAALRRLTEAQGDFAQLGFVAQPGYERIVRRTRLVVIRLDVDAGLARSKLRPR